MASLRRAALAVVLVLPLVGGCAFESINLPAEGSGVGSGALISASVQVPVAAPGEGVLVRFVNSAPHLFSVNTCLRQVERKEGALWVRLPEEFRLCAQALLVIGALSEASRATDVPTDAIPGEYRFRFSMTQPTGPAVDVATPAFRVE